MNSRTSRFLKRHWLALVITGIVVIGWILPNTVFLMLSGSSKTCASCHIMQPAIDEWSTSVHSQVKCTTCHDLGFNYFTRMSFATWTGMYNPSPVTVVSDRVCIKCHALSDISKPGLYKNRVYFDHTKHVGKSVREMMLTCETCHPSVTHGSDIGMVDEDACISCHFIGAPRGEAITGCPSCHGSPTKTVDFNGMEFNHKSYLTKGMQCNQCHLDVIKGQGNVPRDRCHQCHEDRSYKYNNPVFVHNTHVTKEHLTCDKCHTPMKHGEIHMIQALESSCTDCHKDRHNNQREMYMGIGARDTVHMPDSMFSIQVSCEGCHPDGIGVTAAGTKLSKAGSLRKTAQACVVCHGRPYGRLMYNWITVGNGMIHYVSSVTAKASSVIDHAAIGTAKKAEAQKLLTDALFNRRFASLARPSHNIRYTQQMLINSLNLVDKATAVAGTGKLTDDRPLSLQSVGASCAVLCHKTLGMPKTVKFETLGVDFPHDFHQNLGLDCAACHPTEHSMAMDIKVDTCANCHHGNPSTSNCILCHSASASLYKGTIPFSGLPHTPNVMSGTVGCADCHALIQPGKIYSSVRKRCIECHVPSYGTLLDTWNGMYVKKYEQAELLLKNTSIELEGMDKNSKKYKEKKARYDDASAKLSYLGKANGIHNILLTEKIFDSVLKELK